MMLQRNLKAAEIAQRDMNENYASKHEELTKRTEKLKKLWLKTKEKQRDLNDIQVRGAIMSILCIKY